MNSTLDTLTIATAGHVDHGKSTLVKLITGTDTDTLAEEKSRGLSINLGFAYLPFVDSTNSDTRHKSIAFVDVPGHVDFTANMLAGVGMVETCMLVIAADDGIMPQTREHLAILDLLGVNQGCVVISKIDRVDTARRDQVKQDVANLLADTSLRML
ncbi:MAG: GTP-binding protein, partial [Pseudohongiellaceae bacterium]